MVYKFTRPADIEAADLVDADFRVHQICFKYPALFDLFPAQTQAVADDEYAAGSHGGGSDHGVEQAGGRGGDENDVVDEGPEEVLLDGAQRLAR